MTMKNIFIYTIVSLLFCCAACNDDDENGSVKVTPDDKGVYTDERDGHEYNWIRYGNLEWMVENMRFEAEEGYYNVYIPSDLTDKEYDLMFEKNYSVYGYLYDWEAALSVVPEGWRLPTDEDWKALEISLGMSSAEAERIGWRGNMEGDFLRQEDFLHLQTGGFYDCRLKTYGTEYIPYNISVCGMFWSASKDEMKSAEAYIFREVRYNSGQINRNSTIKEKLMSVRCVRDVRK